MQLRCMAAWNHLYPVHILFVSSPLLRKEGRSAKAWRRYDREVCKVPCYMQRRTSIVASQGDMYKPCSRTFRGTSCRRSLGGRARRRRIRCSRARTRTALSGSRTCRSPRCRAGTPACNPRRRSPSGRAGRSAGPSSRSCRCTGLKERKPAN